MFSPLALTQETGRVYRVPFRSVNGMILLDAAVNGKPAALLLDTGANSSIVDVRSAGFYGLKLDVLRSLLSMGRAGATGTCAIWEAKLSLERRSWLNRRVCVLDLSDVSWRMGVRIDGFIGQDVLRDFSSVRIDYRNSVVELQ